MTLPNEVLKAPPPSVTVAPPEPVVIVSVTAVSVVAEKVRLELVEEQFVHEPSKANALPAKMRTAVGLRRKRNATLIFIR